MTDDNLQNDCDPLFKVLMAELKPVNDLDDAAIKLIRVITDLGNQFGKLIDKLENDPFYDENDIELNVYTDPRWLAIGKTHLQTGVMCLKRAVSKPDDF